MDGNNSDKMYLVAKYLSSYEISYFYFILKELNTSHTIYIK